MSEKIELKLLCGPLGILKILKGFLKSDVLSKTKRCEKPEKIFSTYLIFINESHLVQPY